MKIRLNKTFRSVGVLTAIISIISFSAIFYISARYAEMNSIKEVTRKTQVDATKKISSAEGELSELLLGGGNKQAIDALFNHLQGEVADGAITLHLPKVSGKGVEVINDESVIRALNGDEITEKIGNSVRVIKPLVVSGDCLSCHSDFVSGKVFAAIEVSKPVNDIENLLLGTIHSIGYPLFGGMLLISFGLYMTFRYFVISPVNQVAEKIAEMVGKNVFSEKIVVESAARSREVLLLEENFNNLLCAVRREQGRLLQKDEQLKLSAKLFDNSREGIVITDKENKIVAANNSFLKTSGYEIGEILGKDPKIFASGQHDADFYVNMWARLNTSGHWSGLITDRRKDDSIYEKWLSIDVVRNKDGEITHYVSIHSDNSERREAEKHIHRLAYYDTLTGLPNRALLKDRLSHEAAIASRENTHFSILFLDLDRFKYINDSMGHAAGDKLLQFVAGRLTECVREVDTVARIGGDEFIVLLHNTGLRGAESVANHIIAALALPHIIDGQEIVSKTSIGITSYPDDGRNVDSLVKNADIAMYQAKKAGRNNYKVFHHDMNSQADALFLMEKDIAHALDHDEFFVEYQLQFNLDSGTISGAEALVRWNHPVKGLIPPSEFISVAEETGQIISIGDFVLRKACMTASKWHRDGYRIPIAINVSTHQLRRSSFIEDIRDVLAENNMPPDLLELELTESILMDSDNALELLSEIRGLGVMLAIDDFGTGYSSLSYLKKLPVTQLKIDRSFIQDIEFDQNDAAVVQTIIDLGHRYNMKVLAEGLETSLQVEILCQMGCDRVQGFLYGRPMSEELFIGYLSASTLEAAQAEFQLAKKSIEEAAAIPQAA